MSSEQCCGVLDHEFHVRHGLLEHRIGFFWTVYLPLVELRMNLVDLSLYVLIHSCSGMKLKRE